MKRQSPVQLRASRETLDASPGLGETGSSPARALGGAPVPQRFSDFRGGRNAALSSHSTQRNFPRKDERSGHRIGPVFAGHALRLMSPTCEGQWTGVEVRKSTVSAGLGTDATDGCGGVVPARRDVGVRRPDTGPGAVRGSPSRSRPFAGGRAVAGAAGRGEATKRSACGGPQVCLQRGHLKMNEEGKYTHNR